MTTYAKLFIESFFPEPVISSNLGLRNYISHFTSFQLGAQGQDPTSPSSQPEKQTFREQFKAPEMSIVSRLMIKVSGATTKLQLIKFSHVGAKIIGQLTK